MSLKEKKKPFLCCFVVVQTMQIRGCPCDYLVGFAMFAVFAILVVNEDNDRK